MSAVLLPQGKQQYFSNAGVPLAGGKVYTYDSGTSNPRTTWGDAAQTAPNANPVILDGRGEALIFWAGAYRVTVKDALDNIIWTVDGISQDSYADTLRSDLASTTSGSEGSQLVGYRRTEAGSIARTVYSVLNQSVHIADFGGVPDDATDTVAPLNAAMAALAAMGGGTLHWSPGTYRFTAVTTYSVRVPVAIANFQTATQAEQVHAAFQNYSHIRWLGKGTILKTAVTNAGEMFIFDGARNFEIEGITLQTPYAHDAAGNPTTVGMNGFGFTSQTRDSYGIRFKNCEATSVYAAIYIFGDTLSAFRVRGVQIDNFRHDNGHYTLALHNNGDNVTGRGLQSNNTLRPCFWYGVDRPDVEMLQLTGVNGFSSLLKAYDRDLTNARFKLRTSSNATSVPAVSLQSQHAPAVQPVSAKLKGIYLDIDNRGVTGPGSGFDLTYFRDAAAQGTMADKVFDNINLAGVIEQAPVINSVQTGAANQGLLNTDGVILLNGSLESLYINGFNDSKQRYGTGTPGITINGSAVGITYSAQLMDWWRDGRFVYFQVDLTLSNKGASVGAVALTGLPFASAGSLANTLISGHVVSNGAGITGPLTGFVVSPATTANLLQQGAAAVASLTDANLTNTTRIRINGRYPINL